MVLYFYDILHGPTWCRFILHSATYLEGIFHFQLHGLLKWKQRDSIYYIFTLVVSTANARNQLIFSETHCKSVNSGSINHYFLSSAGTKLVTPGFFFCCCYKPILEFIFRYCMLGRFVLGDVAHHIPRANIFPTQIARQCLNINKRGGGGEILQLL